VRFTPTSTAEEVCEGLDLTSKTFLVTGCSSGLGLETMRVLALRGARVLGAARTAQQAERACGSVLGDTAPVACDLSDPASVRAAARAVDEPLHAIVANAGVMALPELSLIHGVEAHLLVNHVGHFMLVTALLPRLTARGRVVVLASGAHSYARGDAAAFEDLGWDGPYAPWVAYGRSKLANILFARELSRRLPSGQTANSVHPGLVETPLWRHLPAEEQARMKRDQSFRSSAQGAATQVFVATHPSVAKLSGKYFGDCKMRKASAPGRDDALAATLWATTERLVARL
jgi:WW domain-containing oxidoreductase